MEQITDTKTHEITGVTLATSKRSTKGSVSAVVESADAASTYWRPALFERIKILFGYPVTVSFNYSDRVVSVEVE